MIAAAERRVLEDLREKFTETPMKNSADKVLSDLEYVENNLRNGSIRNARMVLETVVIPRRKKLQEAFERYGATVTLIPS
jgi:hypothetical protein